MLLDANNQPPTMDYSGSEHNWTGLLSESIGSNQQETIQVRKCINQAMQLALQLQTTSMTVY